MRQLTEGWNNLLFSSKLQKISETNQSRIILSLDLTCSPNQILKKSISIIKSTSDNICAVKINHHLLLPLSLTEIKKLISVIHSRNLLVIADLKLKELDLKY